MVYSLKRWVAQSLGLYAFYLYGRALGRASAICPYTTRLTRFEAGQLPLLHLSLLEFLPS